MHPYRRLVRPASITCAAAILAACGGGGGGNSAPPVARPLPTASPTSAPTTCASVQASNGRRPVARFAPGSPVVPDQLYVSYRASAMARGVQSLDRAANALRALDLGSTNGVAHRAVTLTPGSDAAAVAAQLRATAGVVDVSPVHVRMPLQVVTPNDPYFNNSDQWYLFKTDIMPDGWSFLPRGAGVAIAVIDTGVDETNADLLPKLDVRERVVNGAVTTGAGTVQDSDGHGTNVAGLAAAATNDGYGFASDGYNARLQVYKIFPDATATSPCPTASTTDEARAIQDAVTNGASIINLSLGAAPATGFDQAEHDAVEAAIAAGVTVVAAGGNDSGATPDYPGGYPGVIAVGASNVKNTTADSYASITSEGVATYSNSGVTLVAPGGDPSGASDLDTLHWIEGFSTTTAALPANRCTNTGGVCRVFFAGTSQATPQVAGTAALMMAYHGGPRSLSPATVSQLLQQSAVNIGQASGRQGAGRLNAGAAVAAAHP